ncbi:kinase-like domain-containing protein [Myxozyma melibiosi]|uniref:Serine/threonine-protein kinase 1 n=1 Tax=Myxozyma melibiosi TaxID=54550 RepID=A0ABR1FA30_9ASCO
MLPPQHPHALPTPPTPLPPPPRLQFSNMSGSSSSAGLSSSPPRPATPYMQLPTQSYFSAKQTYQQQQQYAQYTYKSRPKQEYATPQQQSSQQYNYSNNNSNYSSTSNNRSTYRPPAFTHHFYPPTPSSSSPSSYSPSAVPSAKPFPTSPSKRVNSSTLTSHKRAKIANDASYSTIAARRAATAAQQQKQDYPPLPQQQQLKKRKKVVVVSEKLNGYTLIPEFEERYQLGDELGSGGFGFVMSATRQSDGREVAAKFIYRSKIPSHSWIHDRVHGMLPMELYVLLRVAEGGGHASIIRFYEYFQDEIFFVLITELHGTPWSRKPKTPAAAPRQPLTKLAVEKIQNMQALGKGPEQLKKEAKNAAEMKSDGAADTDAEGEADCELDDAGSYHSSLDGDYVPPHSASSSDVDFSSEMDVEYDEDEDEESEPESEEEEPEVRVAMKRDSHDLFEMIETRKNLTERQVRYMMRQIVNALWYLDSLGIYHRDIKDENILVDNTLTVKLIDFGSAVVLPPLTTPPSPPHSSFSSSSPSTAAGRTPRPLRAQFRKFYGTLQYAPVEVLQSQPYDAEKSDVWALGILIYTCLTGQTPFRSPDDAINKQWDLTSKRKDVSPECLDFLGMCLQKNAARRGSIDDLARSRWWLVDLP